MVFNPFSSSSSSRFRLFSLTIAVLAGLGLLALTLGSAQAASIGPIAPQDAPGGIRGIVYDHAGHPVQHAWIDIHDIEGHPWMGTASGATGYYEISNLPPGHYVLHAFPPPLGYPDDASSLPMSVHVSSAQWSTQDIELTPAWIKGWVQDSDTGMRIPGAAVVAHDEHWTVERWSGTNISGEFKIGGVDIGVPYILDVFAPEGTEYLKLPIDYVVVPITADVVLEMHIPPISVVGIVHNPIGNPVPGAGVVVFHDDFWLETAADELGHFDFRALPPGEFWIQAAPPWGPDGFGLLSSPPFTITVSHPPTVMDVGIITLPHTNKMVTGKVLNSDTGHGVFHAVVRAHRLDEPGYADTPTDPSGFYTLSLPGGEWHVEVEPVRDAHHPLPEWIFPGPPAWIVFQKPYSETEQLVADLEVVPTDAWVAGNIRCPGGGVCPGSPEPHDIWVELRNEHIGSGMHLQSGYDFEIPIPAGWYEVFVHVDHPELQGPEPFGVHIGPGQYLDVGMIELLLKDAVISGVVRDQQGHGIGGVPVFGWQPERFAWGWAETDPQGVYTMPVIGGEWFVEPHPRPEMPFVYRHRPRHVRVAPGGHMHGIDFSLTFADSLVLGAAVDAQSHERLWGLDGWVWAQQIVAPDHLEHFSDAPMWDSGFELKVAGGLTYVIGIDLPPHAPYVSGHYPAPMPIDPNSMMTLTVPLEHKDAVIWGSIIDASTMMPPAHDVWGEVFGWDERGNWGGIGIDPEHAEYGMAVVSGTWHLRAWVDPECGYVAVPTTTLVTVTTGSHILQDFYVWPTASHIKGRVLQPDGLTGMSMTVVYAEGHSPFVGHFEAVVETDPDGFFDILVPLGEYRVGAGLPPDELAAHSWLNPPPIEWVESPTTGLILEFIALNAEIEGEISFDGGGVMAKHPTYVWGWSEDGHWMETGAMTATDHTFTYTLPVVSGSVWHVGAVYEDSENGYYYESLEVEVDMTAQVHIVQPLTLTGPYMLPQPFIVSFDASQMQTIIMPDGTMLTIPPGSLSLSGTVTLFIFPTQEMRPEPGQELVGTGYEMWAVDGNGQEITQFNQNVMITFQYPSDETLSMHGIREHLLVPVYYSTLIGHWILADSYVVDMTQNMITLQISHFTKFAMMSTESSQFDVYLPVIYKTYEPK